MNRCLSHLLALLLLVPQYVCTCSAAAACAHPHDEISGQGSGDGGEESDTDHDGCPCGCHEEDGGGDDLPGVTAGRTHDHPGPCPGGRPGPHAPSCPSARVADSPRPADPEVAAGPPLAPPSLLPPDFGATRAGPPARPAPAWVSFGAPPPLFLVQRTLLI